MPSLEARTISDFAADIRQSASNGPTAIKDLVGILIKARQQGGLFTGAAYAELRGLLDHPDRWPFRSQWGAETEWVGADVQLAVGHAIANQFLPLDKGSEEGAALYGPADKTAREMALWVYWTRALHAIADRLDEEAKRIDSDAADEATIVTPGIKKPKRSTERGEGRVKLIAALTKHHKYADGGCLNLEPIGNNKLARLAEVSNSTASAFFTKEFEGHTKYRALCGDATRLVTALKLLNQEYSPHHLFGRKPPGEDDRDDEG